MSKPVRRRPKKTVNRKRKIYKKKTNRKTTKKTINRRRHKITKKQMKRKMHLSKIQSNYPARTHKLHSSSTQNNLNMKRGIYEINKNVVGKMYYANLYKNMHNKEKQCMIMNPNQEIVAVPNEYPGDDWVHANLMYNRDKPVEAFDTDDLKEQYHKYRKMC